MFKKLALILIIFILIVGGLQLFGGRDFSQMSLAWDKYTNNGTLGSFFDDVLVIFKGDSVKEGLLPHSRYSKQIVYRWTDEFGEVHVSERKPDVANYETIQLGDLNIQVEESMSDEDIEAQIKKKN